MLQVRLGEARTSRTKASDLFSWRDAGSSERACCHQQRQLLPKAVWEQTLSHKRSCCTKDKHVGRQPRNRYDCLNVCLLCRIEAWCLSEAHYGHFCRDHGHHKMGPARGRSYDCQAVEGALRRLSHNMSAQAQPAVLLIMVGSVHGFT